MLENIEDDLQGGDFDNDQEATSQPQDTGKDIKGEAQEEADSPSDSSEELAQAKDKYIRLVAEFDNYRKRTARERIELIKSAGEDIMGALLDVLDDADRAEQQMDKTSDIDSLKEGVVLIFNKLRNTLKAKGLQSMDSLGTEFDPELHEAITEIPAGSKDQKGKVMDVVQKGYYLNDKIIRHAKVVVGK